MVKKRLNICKKIFYNPLFVSLLLTSIIIIIIVAIYKVQSFGAGMLFKCWFYVFIILGIIIYVHDFLITRELKSNNINKEVKDVFSGIDLSKEISHDIIQVDPIIYEKEDSGLNHSYEKTHERFNKLLNNNLQNENINNGNSSNDSNGSNDSNYSNSNGNSNNNSNDSNDSNDNINNSIQESEKKIIGGDVNSILSSIIDVSVNPSPTDT